jgi:hydroxymethylpyrimidine pyrophosphatase-like HAD family hydrolase
MAKYRKIAAYDLDGTLLDSSHRYRALPNGNVDLDHWLANRYRCLNDTLLPLADTYKAHLAEPQTYVIICTLRTPTALDILAIRTLLGMPDLLIMNDKDQRTDMRNYKRRHFARLFNLRQFKHLPRFFWEDSQVYVDTTRDLFTRVFHVRSEQEFTA